MENLVSISGYVNETIETGKMTPDDDTTDLELAASTANLTTVATLVSGTSPAVGTCNKTLPTMTEIGVEGVLMVRLVNR